MKTAINIMNTQCNNPNCPCSLHKKIKIDDWVYTTKNFAWGMEVMRVVNTESTFISCEHPQYGRGGFREDELTLATCEYKAKLKILQNEIQALKDEFFGD